MRAVALLMEGSCSPQSTLTEGIDCIMGCVGTAGPSFSSPKRPCLFARMCLLIVVDLTVATVVNLLLQPVDIYYCWDGFLPQSTYSSQVFLH